MNWILLVTCLVMRGERFKQFIYNVQRLLYNMFQGKIENIIKQFLGKIFFITGTWSFLALSLLYIGPNLFLPPLIRSCRTAEMEKYPLFQNKKKHFSLIWYFTIFELKCTMNLAVSNKNLTPEGGALRMCKTTTFTTIFQYNSRQLCIAQPHFTCMSCTWSIDC